jgi:hypothetical protein
MGKNTSQALSNRYIPVFERLEDRIVPSGNVKAFFGDGTLFVIGDGNSNRISISGFNSKRAIITSLDGTTINGRTDSVWVDGIDHGYDIRLGDGDDQLFFPGAEPEKNLFIDMGNGSDLLTIINMQCEREGFITLGEGNNSATIYGSIFQKNLYLVAGRGNDYVEFLATIFQKNLHLASTGGNDVVGATEVKFDRDPTIIGFRNRAFARLPVANADQVNANQGQAIVINVAANDVANQGAIDPASIVLVTPPSQGGVMVNPDGTVTYVAPANGGGTDVFQYTIRNSRGATSNVATVFVNIIDIGPPDVTLTTTAPNQTNLSSIPVTATFSEFVTGLTPDDITVTNGTATNLVSTDGRIYTFQVIPAADGQVQISIGAGVARDTTGNNNTPSNTITLTSDRSPPTVTLTTTANNPTNLASIPVTATFSEDVTTLMLSDIGTLNAQVQNLVRVNARTYTFNLIPNADGIVRATIAAGAVQDAAGNGNIAPSFSIVSDRTAPMVAITTPNNPTNANPIPFTATFTEDVTGFVLADIVVTNGTAGNFVAVNAQTYTFNVTPAAAGQVTVTIPANVAQDAAGNGNVTASITITFTP